MKLKRYLVLLRAGIIESMQFRLSMLFTFVGNLLYLLLVYYLWKAIFASSDTGVVNGMTFQDTMIYLVFATALFNFMEMWIVWDMGRDIQKGQIVVDLLKPMNYRNFRFFLGCGEMITKFFTTFFPTAIIVFIVSKGAIHIGINLLWFVVSVIFSVLINYYINFMVGTICMYTESIWGINIMKEVIIGILSGVTVPIAFFPDVLKDIAMLLPFQAICNSPMQVLLHPEYEGTELFSILGLQLIWVVVLFIVSEAFFRVSVRKITVNGG